MFYTLYTDDRAWADEPDQCIKIYDPAHGRLIYLGEEPGKPNFFTLDAAKQKLKECYPTAIALTHKQMEQEWRKDGYHYPGRYDTYTHFLCNCGANLPMEKDSLGAGMNAPMGALVTTYYQCRECDREYACGSQERQYGWSHEWSFRPNGTGHFEECAEPQRIPDVNPYGFLEIHLVPTKLSVVSS